ncbi:MAG TPA: SDR family oxidoreductase [Longimicrobiales bacterium]
MIPQAVLSGKRIVVAGGAGHVGTVLVDALLHAGAAVAVPSRSAARLDALREALADAPVERLVAIEGDVADATDGERVRAAVLDRLGGLDAVIASMGDLVAAPAVLDASPADVRRALDGYVVAHHGVARTLLPALRERGGSYTFINGFLAYGPVFPGAGLVAMAGAAQAMLARVLMQENERTNLRVNEVVLYTSFGRPDDDERNRNGVGKQDVAAFITELVSPAAERIRGQSIHLKDAVAVRQLAD